MANSSVGMLTLRGAVVGNLQDPTAVTVQCLNRILEALGVSPAYASTRIHARPQAVHIIYPQDLLLLVRNVSLLVSGEGIHCDYSALSLILWGMLNTLEFQLDKMILDAVPLTDGMRPSAGRDHKPVLYKGNAAFQKTLVRAGLVMTILCAFEESSTPGAVRDKTIPAKEDVELAIRLASKVATLLSDSVTGADGKPATCVTKYDTSSHRTVQLLERNLCSVWLLLSAVTSRPSVDLAPIVSAFNSTRQWSVSGCSVVTTEVYCRSIRYILDSIYARPNEFNNAVDIASQLILKRIADRPPFVWEVARLLMFNAREYATAKAYAGAACLGMLQLFREVQTNVEACLIVSAASEHPARASSVQAVRKALVRHFGRLQSNETSDTQLLSYFQLTVLAAVCGMHTVDLTEKAALVNRARRTSLTTNEAILDADFLRILLACCYTIPTALTEQPHGSLSASSIFALYKSFATFVVQEDVAFSSVLPGRPTAVNPMVLSPSLKLHTLVNLLVRNAVEEADDEVDALTVKTASEYHRGLLALVGRTIQKIYAANDALHQQVLLVGQGSDSQSSPLAKTSPVFFAVTTLMSVLLFSFFDSEAFLRRVELTTALTGMVQVYALRAASPLPGAVRPDAQRQAQEVLLRMQRRLAYIPQRMRTCDIEQVLMHRVAPLSATHVVARSNNLRLSFLEGYLRSLSTSSTAFAISDEVMLAHWIEVTLPALTNPVSAALALAAHDFLVAPFLAQKTISALFVPTYVTVLIPTRSATDEGSKYGEPPVVLVQRFAAVVRAACQGLQRCDGALLQSMLDDPRSAVSTMVTSNVHRQALKKITPTSAMLLIVSALFDKLCVLWSAASAFISDAQSRFVAYFSALVNLLRCNDTEVLYRVCASIEAIEVEHLRSSRRLQLEFLKYVEAVVDGVKGNSKKGVAEWFLKLSERVLKDGNAVSKL